MIHTVRYGATDQFEVLLSVNASKDKFIGKVCRELNDIASPSRQGCAFPSKVDALMAGVPEAVLSSVKHRHIKI